MGDRPPDPVSPYLLKAPRPLREACQRTGLDQNGGRCATCPLRQLCQSEERWLVKLPS